MNKVDPKKYQGREARFRLWPNVSASDKAACEILDSVSQSERGNFMRTAMTAGMALHRIDSRLPLLLTAILKSDTTVEELVTTLGLLVPTLKDHTGTVEELAAQLEPELAGVSETAKGNLNKLVGR